MSTFVVGMALAAAALTVALIRGVCLIKGMPVFAGCLRLIRRNDRGVTKDIDGHSDLFHVIGIDASGDEAEVVDSKARINRPVNQFIRKAVRINNSSGFIEDATRSELTVPGARMSAEPEPTGAEVGTAKRNGASLVDLSPKAFFGRSDSRQRRAPMATDGSLVVRVSTLNEHRKVPLSGVMRRAVLSGAAALIIGLMGLIYMVATPAESHHNGEFFAIPRNSFTLMLRMEKLGYFQWSYEQRCSLGNIEADVAGAMSDTAARYGVPHPQVSAQSGTYTDTWKNVSTCGTDFTARCGGGFAVACVGADPPGFPRNCDAYYDGPYMATFYSFASRKSVPKHEYKHCADMRAEGYNDIAWNCNPVPPSTYTDTIMGCGPQHSQEYTARDDWDWFIVHIPPQLNANTPKSFYGTYAENGKTYAYYCSTSVNSDRVYLYYDRGEGLIWSGEQLPPASNNTCKNVEVYPGWCYWAKQTSALADPLWPNEIKIGCT